MNRDRLRALFLVTVWLTAGLSFVGPVRAAPALPSPRPTPIIELVRQSVTVAADGRFELVLRASNADPAQDEATVTIHQRIRSLSRLESTFGGTNLGGSESFDVKRLNEPGSPVDASGAVTTTFQLQIGDPCVITVGRCVLLGDPGVYPVEVAIRSRATAKIWSSFVTHLVYVNLINRSPLAVAVIVPFHRDVSKRPTGALGTLASPLVTIVDRLMAHPNIPLTLAATPETLDELDQPTSNGGSDPDLLVRLRGALVGREVVAGSYIDIADRHLGDPRMLPELRMARRTGEQVARRVLGFATDATTLVLNESERVPSSAALDALGVKRIVAAESQLDRRVAPSVDAPVTFDRGSADDRPVEGLPLYITDPLTQMAMTNVVRPGDVLLAVHHALTSLAFHQLTATGADRESAVVVRLEPALITSASLDRLLEGLAGNPLLRPVTLRDAFRLPAAINNGHVVSHTWPQPPIDKADPGTAYILETRRRIDGYASMFPDGSIPVKAGDFNRQLLAGLARDLPDNRWVVRVREQLNDEFAHVKIEGNKSFRLTSRKAKIPLRFSNSLDGPVKVRLAFRADKLTTPAPADLELVPGPTNTRYAIRSRSPGRSSLVVILETPRNAIPISQASYVVRSTAASWVGIALTIGALAVLTVWWGGHGFRGRARRRHPAQVPVRPEDALT